MTIGICLFLFINCSSGKCQILHWRQGHKNECGVPRIDDCFVAQVGITPLNRLTVEGSDLHTNNHPNSEGNYQVAVMTSSKKLSSTSSYSSEAFSDDEFLNSSGTESASDSSDSSSSSYSVFFGPVKPFNAFSSAVYPSVLHKSGSEIQSSSNISRGIILSSNTLHDKVRTAVDYKVPFCVSKDAENSPLGSKLINSESCSNFELSKDDCKCESISSITQSATVVNLTDSTTYKERENSILDTKSHMRDSWKVPDEAICSQTKSRNEMLSLRSLSGVAQIYTTVRTSLNESHPPYGSKSHSGQLIKPKSTMSVFPAFVEEASPAGQFISDYASRKVHNPPKTPAKVRYNNNAESHSSGTKTSVQRVVQLLKLSKLSQQHTSRFAKNPKV